MSSSVALTGYGSAELRATVDRIAAKHILTRSELLVIAINYFVQRVEEQEAMTRGALQDVSNGNVISHREMEAWVESLGTNSPLPAPFTRSPKV